MPVPLASIDEDTKRLSADEKKEQMNLDFNDEKISKKKLHELDSADIASIIETEKTEMLSHDDIASKHKISTALAGRIIRANKKNKDFIKKRQHKEHEDIELRTAIKQLIGDWDEDEDGMLSLGRLQKKLKEETEIVCSVTTVRKIMRNELGLRFKKVKQLAPQTNKLKNVLCRMRYAMIML